MTRRLSNKIEAAGNLAIVAMSVVAGLVLYQRWTASGPVPSEPNSVSTREWGPAEVLPKGTHLALPGVDWDKSVSTLVLVLSTRCHICSASAPFYRRLSSERHRSGARIATVAVLPENREEATSYLATLGILVDARVQASPSDVGVPGTPVLLLVDKAGAVRRSWIGRPTAAQESEILASLIS